MLSLNRRISRNKHKRWAININLNVDCRWHERFNINWTSSHFNVILMDQVLTPQVKSSCGYQKHKDKRWQMILMRTVWTISQNFSDDKGLKVKKFIDMIYFLSQPFPIRTLAWLHQFLGMRKIRSEGLKRLSFWSRISHYLNPSQAAWQFFCNVFVTWKLFY